MHPIAVCSESRLFLSPADNVQYQYQPSPPTPDCSPPHHPATSQYLLEKEELHYRVLSSSTAGLNRRPSFPSHHLPPPLDTTPRLSVLYEENFLVTFAMTIRHHTLAPFIHPFPQTTPLSSALSLSLILPILKQTPLPPSPHSLLKNKRPLTMQRNNTKNKPQTQHQNDYRIHLKPWTLIRVQS